MASTRQRGKGGPGALQWAALGLAAVIILGLAFTLGMLVGRQWARQTQPMAAAEFPRRTAPVPRRGGLTEVGAERAPQEKLTFYQTLTAPLGAVPPSGKGDAPAKPGAPAKSRPSPGQTPERTDATMPPRAAAPGSRERTGLSAGETKPTEHRQEARAESPVDPGSGQEAPAEWTVQVGVFKSLQQAAGVKKQLADGGFEAQVSPMTAADGQVRYRVRVGTFKTKEDAVRTAERVRSDRSLPTFVTAK